MGSRGDRKRTWHGIFGSRVNGSMTLRLGSASVGCSSSMNRGVRAGLRGTGSGTLARSQHVRPRDMLNRQTCQVCGAGRTSSTCRPTWLEGRRTHVGRSTELRARSSMRPRARRGPAPMSWPGGSIEQTSTPGRLAARGPSGEEAQRDLAPGPRQPAFVTLQTRRMSPHMRARGLAASRRRWLMTASRSMGACRRWLAVIEADVARGGSQRESSTRVGRASAEQNDGYPARVGRVLDGVEPRNAGREWRAGEELSEWHGISSEGVGVGGEPARSGEMGAHTPRRWLASIGSDTAPEKSSRSPRSRQNTHGERQAAHGNGEWL